MAALNRSLFEFIHNWSGRSALLDGTGVFLANYLPYLLVLGFLLLVLAEPGKKRKAFFFIEAAFAVLVARGILTELIRFLYFHPRPFAVYGFAPLIPESDASFPSGHMTFFFPLATVIYFYHRRWGIAYLVLSAIVGLARIYVGVHWPADIAGGIILGILCGWLVHRIFKADKNALWGGAPVREAPPAA